MPLVDLTRFLACHLTDETEDVSILFSTGLKMEGLPAGRHAAILRPKFEAVLAALHPGTVDSALSAPFRGAQIGRPAPDAARDLLAVLDTLQPADSGGFWAYDGQRLPW